MDAYPSNLIDRGVQGRPLRGFGDGPNVLRPLLAYEDDDQGDHERVNSDRFGKPEAQNHGRSDGAFSIGVAADGLCGSPCTDTQADARSDAAKTDGQARREQLHRVNGTLIVSRGLRHYRKKMIHLLLSSSNLVNCPPHQSGLAIWLQFEP